MIKPIIVAKITISEVSGPSTIFKFSGAEGSFEFKIRKPLASEFLKSGKIFPRIKNQMDSGSCSQEHEKESQLEPVHKRQIPLLAFPIGKSMSIKMLNNDPPVMLIKGFLRRKECRWLRKMAEPLLKPSTTVENDQLVIRDYRNSWTAHVTTSGAEPQDPILHSILSRVSAFSGLPISHIEGINIVRYRFGERYSNHHDYFTSRHMNTAGKGGERLMTFFVYLNDVPEDAGGATSFPKLGLKIQPKVGTCAFWMNTDPTGKIYYDKTLHSGEEIKKEGVVKYAMNIWVRQNPMV